MLPDYEMCYLTVRTKISKGLNGNILSHRNYRSYLVVRQTKCKMPPEILHSPQMSGGKSAIIITSAILLHKCLYPATYATTGPQLKSGNFSLLLISYSHSATSYVA
jgi:hypothetical protein